MPHLRRMYINYHPWQWPIQGVHFWHYIVRLMHNQLGILYNSNDYVDNVINLKTLSHSDTLLVIIITFCETKTTIWTVHRIVYFRNNIFVHHLLGRSTRTRLDLYDGSFRKKRFPIESPPVNWPALSSHTRHPCNLEKNKPHTVHELKDVLFNWRTRRDEMNTRTKFLDTSQV